MYRVNMPVGVYRNGFGELCDTGHIFLRSEGVETFANGFGLTLKFLRCYISIINVFKSMRSYCCMACLSQCIEIYSSISTFA